MKGRDVRICFMGGFIVQATFDPDCLGWPRLVYRATFLIAKAIR